MTFKTCLAPMGYSRTGKFSSMPHMPPLELWQGREDSSTLTHSPRRRLPFGRLHRNSLSWIHHAQTFSPGTKQKEGFFLLQGLQMPWAVPALKLPSAAQKLSHLARLALLPRPPTQTQIHKPHVWGMWLCLEISMSVSTLLLAQTALLVCLICFIFSIALTISL